MRPDPTPSGRGQRSARADELIKLILTNGGRSSADAPRSANGARHPKRTRQRRGNSAPLRFIDLFCGIGGFRLAFERAGAQCVFSSDWDKFSRQTYAANFGEEPAGDINAVPVESIPNFDILCAGFPCQPFTFRIGYVIHSFWRKRMQEQLTQYVQQLIDSEEYDEAEGCYEFDDGTHCGICTNGARKIAKRFHGAVWGYAMEDNPTATIGREICFGHDFAIVESRWLVDYWGYRYAEQIPGPVLDMRADDTLIHVLYGKSSYWTCVASYARRRSVKKDHTPMVGKKGFVRFSDLAGHADGLAIKG